MNGTHPRMSWMAVPARPGRAAAPSHAGTREVARGPGLPRPLCA